MSSFSSFQPLVSFHGCLKGMVTQRSWLILGLATATVTRQLPMQHCGPAAWLAVHFCSFRWKSSGPVISTEWARRATGKMHMALTSLDTIKPWDSLQFRLKKKKDIWPRHWTSLFHTYFICPFWIHISIWNVWREKNTTVPMVSGWFSAAVSRSWYVNILCNTLSYCWW